MLPDSIQMVLRSLLRLYAAIQGPQRDPAAAALPGGFLRFHRTQSDPRAAAMSEECWRKINPPINNRHPIVRHDSLRFHERADTARSINI